MYTRKSKSVLRLAAAGLMTLSTGLCAAGSLINVAAEDDGTDNVIDVQRKGSITIHKYDLNAAERNEVDVSSFTAANGMKNEEAENILKPYAIEGVEFTYVKAADILTYSVDGRIEVVYNVAEDLADVLNLQKDTAVMKGSSPCWTSDQINDAMKALLDDDLKSFGTDSVKNTEGKNALEDYIHQAASTVKMAKTDENGVTSTGEISVGLYLFVETEVPQNVQYTTNPFFVSVPMTDSSGDKWIYNIDAYPKNQTDYPTIRKLVKQAENETLAEEMIYQDYAYASQGDVLDYRVSSHLPNITDQTSYLTKYEFADTLPEGLSYKKDTGVGISFYSEKGNAEQGTGTPLLEWDADSGNFTVTYNDTDNTMTVAITDQGLNVINSQSDNTGSASWLSHKYISVFYQAVMKTDGSAVLGDEGNINDVVLTWRRTNKDDVKYEQSIADKAIVYTYGLDITKTFSDDAGDPEQVQFTLFNDVDKFYLTAERKEAGIYQINGISQTEKGSTKFVPDSEGRLIIKGIEANRYLLREVHSDNGYSLLKEDVVLNINGTKDTFVPSAADSVEAPSGSPLLHRYISSEVVQNHIKNADGTVDQNAVTLLEAGSSSNAYVPVRVVNTPDFILPTTGGAGTLAAVMIGAAVVSIGIILRTGMNRKNKKVSF